MPSIDLGDVTIHYDDVGQGPLAVVFCHSWPETEATQTFQKDMHLWQAEFGRAMVWDNRGFGQSSPTAKYSLPLFALDLARLLDRLEIRSAVVLGYLWGGVLGQQFALDYPDKCAALVLDSTSPEVNVPASEAWYQRGEEARRNPAIRPENLDFCIALCRTIAGLREHPFTPRLKHVTCPTLIMAGALDTATRGPGGSVILSRQIPNSTLKIFQDGGHGTIRERPQEFRELVVQFCRQHSVI